jgi:alkylation response protein AidB-like acyl-CoA dehydrogenase
VSLDLTRPVTLVELDSVAARDCLASGDTAREALRAALTAGAGMLASEQLAIAEWCLDTTVEYLGQRRQFGRVVGSYQALKHRLADLWVEVGGARAVARHAAALLAEAGPRMEGYTGQDGVELRREIDIAVALAQLQCSSTAVRAAEEAVQLHGGIGMTWELPVHLYLKRAKADQLAFGSAGAHLAHLGELVDLPGPVR